VKMDPFIEAEEVAARSIKHCCELFEVSRAAYYERRRAGVPEFVGIFGVRRGIVPGQCVSRSRKTRKA
jgi:hypothetical protein